MAAGNCEGEHRPARLLDITGNGGPDSIIRAGGQVEFGDALTVENAKLDIMNITAPDNLITADVTIGSNATMGVYTGNITAEEQVCTLTAAVGGPGGNETCDLLTSGEKEYYLFYSGVNSGGQGGNVGAVYLMLVPEPATATLSLMALAALAARRRRGAASRMRLSNLIINK